MADVFHLWGGDLQLSSTGDLLGVNGSEAGRQRVLRRLLTNPEDYIWNVDYGAGLPAQVGQPLDREVLESLVLAQMLMEPAVGRDPLPEVAAVAISHGVSVTIRYRDAETDEAAGIGFDVEQ